MSGNPLCLLLGVEFPLLQAGMGGIAMPRLAAAVSLNGAAGVLALYKHAGQVVADLLGRTRHLTDGPFGVNLIPEIVDEVVLREQIDTVLKETTERVFFTFFGLPPPWACELVRRCGRRLLIQVGTDDEATEAARRGAHALILQGTEAGGHLLGASPLDRLLTAVGARHLGVPLIAAGGIGSGRELQRLSRVGAVGCMCGTMFVATSESSAHPRYKQRVALAAPSDTVITDRFDIGWPRRVHRVLRNRVVETGRALPATMIACSESGGRRYPIPRYSCNVPTDNTTGAVDELAMYCGTSCRDIHQVSTVREVIERFRREAHDVTCIVSSSAVSGGRVV